MSIPAFTPYHIPILFLSPAFTFGGMMALNYGTRTARCVNSGLLEHMRVCLPTTRTAKAFQDLRYCTYASRMTNARARSVDLLQYSRDMLDVCDTLLSLTVYLGVVDGYVCWKEGVPGRGIFRFMSGVVIEGWGYFGMSSWGAGAGGAT